ncbi:MAG: ATP-binding cassette domain-containing protein [Fibrobacteres bacterium]|nr:ATP-binding cassette domain-containing protein [Fibrobacterota bacterium]
MTETDMEGPRSVLSLRSFGARLGGKGFLEGVDLDVAPGEVVAVVGPNGAGKSTLLRAVVGEIPHEGQKMVQGRVGYMPQRLDFDPSSCATVQDLFVASLSRRPPWLGISRSVREAAGESLERVGAQGLSGNRFGKLSGGERQRVLLALAITPLPDLLLMDEPEAGIDLDGLGLLHHQVGTLCLHCRMGVLLATHSSETLQKVAHRTMQLDRGRVVGLE